MPSEPCPACPVLLCFINTYVNDLPEKDQMAWRKQAEMLMTGYSTLAQQSARMFALLDQVVAGLVEALERDGVRAHELRYTSPIVDAATSREAASMLDRLHSTQHAVALRYAFFAVLGGATLVNGVAPEVIMDAVRASATLVSDADREAAGLAMLRHLRAVCPVDPANVSVNVAATTVNDPGLKAGAL